MDRLKAMRQHDWARVFGFATAGGAVALSIAGYDGAQWDALILGLGALMMLRGAVEPPAAAGRADQMLRALRLILFMFAFAAVNSAQGGIEGAVTAALGNWILWIVAALLLTLPLFRKGLARQAGAAVGTEVMALLAAGIAFWLLFISIEDTTDMALLRVLVALAVVANGAPIWTMKGKPVLVATVLGTGLSVVFVTPGEVVWIVALGVLPAALAFGWLRRS